MNAIEKEQDNGSVEKLEEFMNSNKWRKDEEQIVIFLKKLKDDLAVSFLQSRAERNQGDDISEESLQIELELAVNEISGKEEQLNLAVQLGYFLLEKLKELKSTFEEAITNLEADKEDIKKELEFSRQYCDEYQCLTEQNAQLRKELSDAEGDNYQLATHANLLSQQLTLAHQSLKEANNLREEHADGELDKVYQELKGIKFHNSELVNELRESKLKVEVEMHQSQECQVAIDNLRRSVLVAQKEGETAKLQVRELTAQQEAINQEKEKLEKDLRRLSLFHPQADLNNQSTNQEYSCYHSNSIFLSPQLGSHEEPREANGCDQHEDLKGQLNSENTFNQFASQESYYLDETRKILKINHESSFKHNSFSTLTKLASSKADVIEGQSIQPSIFIGIIDEQNKDARKLNSVDNKIIGNNEQKSLQEQSELTCSEGSSKPNLVSKENPNNSQKQLNGAQNQIKTSEIISYFDLQNNNLRQDENSEVHCIPSTLIQTISKYQSNRLIKAPPSISHDFNRLQKTTRSSNQFGKIQPLPPLCQNQQNSDKFIKAFSRKNSITPCSLNFPELNTQNSKISGQAYSISNNEDQNEQANSKKVSTDEAINQLFYNKNITNIVSCKTANINSPLGNFQNHLSIEQNENHHASNSIQESYTRNKQISNDSQMFKSKLEGEKLLQINKSKTLYPRRRDPYEEFFMLLSQCVKLNSSYFDEISSIDMQPLYQEVQRLNIPFQKVKKNRFDFLMIFFVFWYSEVVILSNWKSGEIPFFDEIIQSNVQKIQGITR